MGRGHIQGLICMDAARDSEENRKGNCSAFVRCIEPQASLLFFCQINYQS